MCSSLAVWCSPCLLERTTQVGHVTVTAFPAPCLIMPDNFPDTDSYLRPYLRFLQILAVCASVCAFICTCLSICLLPYRNSCKQCHNECILGVYVFNCSYRLHTEALVTNLTTILAAGGELPACIPEDWRNLVQCCQAANPQDRPTIPELLAMLSLLQHTPPAYDLSAPSATIIRPAVRSLDAAAIASSRPASAGAGYSLSSFSFIDRELSHDKATIHSLGNFNTPVDKPEALTFEPHCTSNIQMAQPLPSDGMSGKNLSSIDSPDHEIDPAEPAQLIPSRGAAGKQAWVLSPCQAAVSPLTCWFETLSHHLVLITESCPTPLILPSARQC